MSVLSVDPIIENAQTISTDFYTSPHWFELSKEKIFARSWQFCGTNQNLHLNGQLYPVTLLPGLLDEPILFVRDINNELHCLSNVCTHRGNLLIESPCLAQNIRCRYHGRRFALNGEFQHMPEFDGVNNFPNANDHLSKIPFGQLGQFLFASINPLASFDAVFSNILNRLFWFPFQEMIFDVNRSRDYLVKAHWALYCENYLEGLHIPFIHKALRSVLDFENYDYELSAYSNLQLGLAKNGEESFDLPKTSLDFGKSVGAYYYWIFPNMMLNFYPWGCSVNVIKPLGPALTKVSFLSFVLDESKIQQGAGGELDKVEREDEAVIESVQKGIRSRFYNSGRYSPKHERGLHHFHQLISMFLG